MGDEFTQELDETKTAIAALDEGIEAVTPELGESLKAAEDALNALQDKEIGSETEQAVSQTEDNLQGVNSEIENHQTTIEERSKALQTYISEQCLPEITTRVIQFAEQLEEVVAKLTEKLQVVKDATERSAQDTID